MFPLRLPDHLMRTTAGGWQLWTDHRYRAGYRLQQHSMFTRWRLLDHLQLRIASGTRSQCEQVLDTLYPLSRWDENESPFIVLLHGLMRSSFCMKALQHHLHQRGCAEVLRYNYASSRASILSHGAAFAEYLESLPQHSRLSFVGHSMGNIVLRAAVGVLQTNGDPRGVLARMHRVVMLGPPNQGALIAKRLAKTGIFGLINGPGGMELGERWAQVQHRLPPPPCPFAILAGDLSKTWLKNPLVGPDSDLLVRVEETKLEGCSKFETMPIVHAILMSHPKAIQFASDFLLEDSRNSAA